MGIIAFLLLGLIAGAIAKLLIPGRDPGGLLATMAIGVVGALLGGFVGGALFGADPIDEFFDVSTWLAAIIGSAALLLVLRMFAGSRA
ncbi:MAG: GlsB/YeaQ/YmgE family stress response membrane protein [Actinomycetota bacterium]|nr:GlsB/YeaQ/YmgE family stress response membrane protein [Actinomycetota bacterium]